MIKTVAIAGLGAIGLPLARALDAGVDGLRLVAVACRDPVKGRANLAGFQSAPRIVEIPELADADIVVECTPAALFERVALPALEAGRIFVPASAGALLPRMHLAKLAAADRGAHYRADGGAAGAGRCAGCRRGAHRKCDD